MLQNLLNNIGLGNFDLLGTLERIFVVIISLSIHEFSHGYRAYKLGDDTAQRAGRLTLNPLAHLDPIGTIMMIIAPVGWARPVPINPILFTRAKTMKRGIVEVSLAGPLSNLVLSFAAYLVLNIVYLIYAAVTGSGTPGGVMEAVLSILYLMFQLNVYLAIFNLLPVPPLDGYKIFGSMLPNHIYYKLMEYERYIGIFFIMVIVFAGTFFGRVLYAVATPFFYLIQTPVDWLFKFLGQLVIR